MSGRRPALSGYRILWLLVMFDLPVGTKAERRHASGFRHALQDQGFQMSQFSVYARHCAGKEAAERYIKEVERALPPAGAVHILTFTDRQYENMKTFKGKKRERGRRNPEQFVLF